MRNKIVNVFAETDLRCGHLGLKLLAKKSKINVETLEAGEFVLFLNKSQMAFKMYAAGNVLVYYRHPRGRINMEAVQFIPSVFGAGGFSYDKALEKVLERRLK